MAILADPISSTSTESAEELPNVQKILEHLYCQHLPQKFSVSKMQCGVIAKSEKPLFCIGACRILGKIGVTRQVWLSPKARVLCHKVRALRHNLAK